MTLASSTERGPFDRTNRGVSARSLGTLWRALRRWAPASKAQRIEDAARKAREAARGEGKALEDVTAAGEAAAREAEAEP